MKELKEGRKNRTNVGKGSQDPLKAYLRDISRFPLLTPEEVINKAQKIQRYTQLKESQKRGRLNLSESQEMENKEREKIEQEGREAKKQMVEANLRLVVYLAKKYQNQGVELLDLIQEGTLGLERAVEKFDPKQGYQFSTYAYWWIRQGIIRAIGSQSRTIRLPVHITEKLSKIKKVQRKLMQEKGGEVKIGEIAREVEMKPLQVRKILSYEKKIRSLDEKVGKEGESELNCLVAAQGESVCEEVAQIQLRQEIEEMLEELAEREKQVLQLRYGLEGGISYTLEQTGKKLKLSRERVRQIEVKALNKLRQKNKRKKLRDYWERMG